MNEKCFFFLLFYRNIYAKIIIKLFRMIFTFTLELWAILYSIQNKYLGLRSVFFRSFTKTHIITIFILYAWSVGTISNHLPVTRPVLMKMCFKKLNVKRSPYF